MAIPSRLTGTLNSPSARSWPSNDAVVASRRPPNAVGGTSSGPAAKSEGEGDRPENPCKAVEELRPLWEFMEAVIDGAEELLENGDLKQKVFPQMPLETALAYNARAQLYSWQPFTKRVAATAVGTILHTPPAIADDTPEELAQLLEAGVDLYGSSLETFTNDLLSESVIFGSSYLLVEYPKPPSELTRKQERDLGLRPYWVQICADDVLDAKTELTTTFKNGVPMYGVQLTQFRFKATQHVPDGKFGSKEEEIIKVYTLVKAEKAGDRPYVETSVWTKTDGDSGRYLENEDLRGRLSLAYIPIFPVLSGKKKGQYFSYPVLLDLAYANIEHFSVASDLRFAMHMQAIPKAVAYGVDELSLDAGPESILCFEDPSAKLEYVAPPPAAYDVMMQRISAIETNMLNMTISILQPSESAAESGIARRLIMSQTEGILNTIASSLENALNGAIAATAELLELDGGSITINRDFDHHGLTPEEVSNVLGLFQGQLLTRKTSLQLLKAGDYFRDLEDFDPELEAEAVDQEIALQNAEASTPAPAAEPDATPALE